MSPTHYSLILHLLGLGLLMAALFGGIVLHLQFIRTAEWPAKLTVLRALRGIGLLSPLGVLVLIASGVGNMTLGSYHYTLFSDGWLSMKLALFAVMVVLGIVSGIQGARRFRVASRLAEGSGSGSDQTALAMLNTRQLVFLFIQLILIVCILWLSVVKPLP